MKEYGAKSWYTYKGNDLGQAIMTENRRIRDVTADRMKMIAKNLCIYGEAGPWALSGGWAKRTPRLAYNAIGNATDALVNDLCQQVIEPQLDNVLGDWGARRRARWAGHACASWSNRESLDTELWPVFARNGLTSGAGFLRPVIEGTWPTFDRVHPLHVRVDDRSSIDTEPRTWAIEKSVDKTWLINKFPKSEREISDAPVPDEEDWTVVKGDSNVVVVEMWRTGRYGEPGLWGTAIEGHLLHGEEYIPHDWPVISWRPMQADMGWWPEPPIYRAVPIQLELNKLLKRTQESMHLHARPIMFVPRQAGIVKAHIVNDVGAVVETDGNWQPTQYTPQSMPSDAYGQMRSYISDIYAVLGVSEMQAQSSLPSGVRLDSSLAMQKFADQGSKRFIVWNRGLNHVRGKVTMAQIRMAAEIAKEHPSFKVVTKRFGQPVRVEWAEMAADIEDMQARISPVNALGNSVSGRINSLFQLAEAGIIDQRQFLQAAKLAEFERIRQLEVAPRELLEEIMEEMLITGDFRPPRPYWDLNFGIGLAARMATMAEAMKTDDKLIQPLRDWMAAAEQLLARAVSPPAPTMTTPAAAPMGPGGMPVPPPLPGPATDMPMPMPMPAAPVPMAG